MNINSLLEDINMRKDTKISVFNNHVFKCFREYNKKYVILYFNDRYEEIDFVGDKELEKINFDINIDKTIDLFDSKCKEYFKYAKEVEDVLEKNINEVIKKSKDQLDEIIKTNFIINSYNLEIIPTFNNYVSAIRIKLYFNKNYFGNFCLLCDDIYYNDEKIYISANKAIASHVKWYTESFISKEYFEIVKHIGIKKVEFKKTDIPNFIVDNHIYGNNYAYVRDDCLKDEKIYNTVKKGLQDYTNNKLYLRLLFRLNQKYSIKSNDDDIYDFSRGNLPAEYNNKYSINELESIIESGIKKYDYLCNINDLNNMEEYTFLNFFFIYKEKEVTIDGDKYVIFVNSRGNYDSRIVFVNGKVTVDLSKLKNHIDVVIINKYHNKNDKNYWGKKSRLRLSVNQLEEHKDKIDWDELGKNGKQLTFEIFMKFFDKFNWQYLLQKRKFKFIELDEIVNKVGWDFMSKNCRNANYLIQNSDKINMYEVLKNPSCTELHEIANILTT